MSETQKLIGDLHIHSRFARACSTSINLANLEKYAKIKGINFMGTGDFTHQKWYDEITAELEEDDQGILWSKTKFPFVWQTEISLMYSQGGKGRRVHYVILAPGKEVVDQIIAYLGSKGRLDYDGRPIFGMSSIEFIDELMKISNKIEVIPAHAWTPWFSIFGSKSGFDSVEECFEEKSKHIHAIETGMSSDPAMNWRVSHLDKYNLVSFSDMHSFWPWRIGREATVFDIKLSYDDIINAIRTGEGLHSTIETAPEYGKYHVDGHRNCNVVMMPKETLEKKGICPSCHKPLTIGVLYRVEQLADREEGYQRKDGKPFKRLIPFSELISKAHDVKQLSSKTVWNIYNKAIGTIGSEFKLLLDATEEELNKTLHPNITKLILKNREDKLQITPGYDGVYGELTLTEDEKVVKGKQKALTGF